ncbi:MAG: hypothetical protein NTZ73_00505 [Candidatus Diapherotrites archaeon]|nr:hypothetical protein [Candidatus Diapherotrites archaeon]
MKKVLIAYYPSGETPKVAEKMAELFSKKGIEVSKKQIELEKPLEPAAQLKEEKSLQLKDGIESLAEYGLVVIGTPVFLFSPVPAVSLFIRNLPDCEGKKFVLFSTSIGLSGTTIKRMQSLLSMKGGKVIDCESFSSIFEFDSKKFLEVEKFFARFVAKE